MVSRTGGVTQVLDEPAINISGRGPVQRPSFEVAGQGGSPDKLMTAVPAEIPSSSPIPTTDKLAGVDKLSDTASQLKTSRQASAGLGAVSALGDIVNAISAYEQIKQRAKTNIQLAHQQAAEAIAIGKEKALREETKGFVRGQEALLSLAAQGQDVRGALAQDVQRQEELFGVYSAMQVEVNSIREAFGYEQEATIYESDIRQAKIQRDTQIFNSVLEGGVSVLAGFA